MGGLERSVGGVEVCWDGRVRRKKVKKGGKRLHLIMNKPQESMI